jgi:hypothetical protein
VWDRSQVDPLPPPADPIPLDPPIAEPEGNTLAWTLPPLTALVGDLGCALVFEDHPAELGGYFAPQTKQISINQIHSVNHQVKTLVHELAHAVLHLSDHDGPALTYAEEELVVESIAVTVVGGLGIDTSGYSIPYLASWSESDQSMAIVETCAALIDVHAKRIEDAIGEPPEPSLPPTIPPESQLCTT